MTPSTTSDPQYPIHEKLQAVQAESQVIGEFLEWLESQGVHLAVYYEERGLSPDRRSIQTVLADYYDIDLDGLEAEKKNMLEKVRKS